MPVEVAERFEADLHVFEGSGHLAFIEEPKAYVSVVRAFLTRAVGAPAS